MSDDKKDPAPPAAPAVHGDKLWDVDKLEGGMLQNLDVTPVDARDMTKKQYLAELGKRGLRMKNQQESSNIVEPDLEAIEAAEIARVQAEQVIIAPDPFTAREAHLFHAMEGVLWKYGLIETLGCWRCHVANRPSGCKTIVNDMQVSVECRCGTRLRTHPKGTSDHAVHLGKFTEDDKTTGFLFDQHGMPTRMPTIVIHPRDVEVLQAYTKLLDARKLIRGLFCRSCFGGRLSQDTMMRESINDTEVVLVCSCKLRYAKI